MWMRTQIEEGARLMLRGLMSELDPTLQEMGRALQELEPALRALVETMGDIRWYEAPEVLPNGDILIRR
ncbi:MAG: AAA+ family ATPase, partial [Rhodobacterales bacterium]|nr:AAA+ family ATPase [Rhodobacterales bacterium]